MAARRVTPLRYTGIATAMVETATATRAVGRGETIKASDIAIERRPKTEVAGDVLGAEQVIGMTSKRALRAGETVEVPIAEYRNPIDAPTLAERLQALLPDRATLLAMAQRARAAAHPDATAALKQACLAAAGAGA